MTRALVLGGGGPVGIGWEAGLIVGLKEAGVDLDAADAVVGTSAGSVVGFTLASGGDLTAATELVDAANQVEGSPGSGDPEAAAAATAGLEQLMATLAEAAADAGTGDGARARLGRMALDAPTIAEDAWLSMFGTFAGADWPATFSCTAVDTATGQFRVWDKAAGVDVQHAVASSCAVPCIFPPVSIGGARWMDGGVRDMVNADVAAGHDAVVVVSCTLLDIPEGLGMDAMAAVFAATRAQIAGLAQAGSRVETIVPGDEMLEISGFGLNLMDFSLAGAAYEAGLRQGKAEADRLSRVWGA